MEIWKPIPGWEGIYSVSNFGRVRRELTHGKGIAGSILNSWLSVTGYPTVRLTNMPKRTCYQVHRLVMAAFVGPCPANKEVNHKNGIKTDPRLENLEYVTRKENMQHAWAMGLQKPHPAWNKGKQTPKSAHFISAKIAINCGTCEHEFLDTPGNHRKYCSRKCADIGRREESAYRVVDCAYCGQSFRYLFAQIGERKYCSRKCAGKINIANISRRASEVVR